MGWPSTRIEFKAPLAECPSAVRDFTSERWHGREQNWKVLKLDDTQSERRLTLPEFEALNRIPHFLEWLANLANQNTRRAYQADPDLFHALLSVGPTGGVCPGHRAPCCHRLAQGHGRPNLQPATIRRKLSASRTLRVPLRRTASPATRSMVFGGPKEGANEASTPALSDAQAKRLLAPRRPTALKGRRDRATSRLYTPFAEANSAASAERTTRSGVVFPR